MAKKSESTITFPSNVSGSLYVGDLDPHISESQLILIFSSIGNVSSVRVCRDLITGRSLGYAYVNYFSRQDATRALEKLNHTPLYGKLIRIMWSNRDPNGRKSGIGNLFVKNLSKSIDNVKLHEIFSKYGSILSCKVSTFRDGKSKGFGFVQFESEESAEKAIENVNGSTVAAKEIYVGHFVKKNDHFVPNPEVEYTNLYIKNLDLDMTEELLQEKFSEFGKICKLTILKDSNGKSNGVAFVNFETPDNAKRAVEEINGTQVGSKIIYVAKAQKKATREQIMRHQFDERCKQHFQHKGSNLYVKNIKCDVHEDELREVFSQCGTITSVRLMRDGNGKSRGFGFICFSTPEEAGKAVNILRGFMLHQKPLYVAIAKSKDNRQEKLQLPYSQNLKHLAGHSKNFSLSAYPSVYYNSPAAFLQIPPHQEFFRHQNLGLKRLAYPNIAAAFRSIPFPMIPITSSKHGPNRGQINGLMLRPSDSIMQDVQPSTQSVISLEGPNNQKQAQTKCIGMDKSELLMSPDSKIIKVKEDEQMRQLSNYKIDVRDAIHFNRSSFEVAVN
ncbi:Polyadenylate-binding protein [Thalictrum thalictroides]|uniref:Polyadenylate-binding protein n=1 Tax=Thalictrum thalictroides TaxID=46969 RepID=A0A7J6UUQ6_THATH|nr:Polyadenylate-binding protein [Thalictrum thalictroides]